MSWIVGAWRDGSGRSGITVASVGVDGWTNFVQETFVAEDEIEIFLTEVAAARQRGREATGIIDERTPGAYERWPEGSEIAENRRTANEGGAPR